MSDEKLRDAVALLAKALEVQRAQPKDGLAFAALAKSYEVAFEYAWKGFKREADAAGMEVYSPRDAIKAAAQLELIKDLETWNRFLNVRNLSVHDYIGISDQSFAQTAGELIEELGQIMPRLA